MPWISRSSFNKKWLLDETLTYSISFLIVIVIVYSINKIKNDRIAFLSNSSSILISHLSFRDRKATRSINSRILLTRIFNNISLSISSRVSNHNSKQGLPKLPCRQEKNRFVLRSKTRSIRESSSTIKTSKDSLRAKNASMWSKKTRKIFLNTISLLRKAFKKIRATTTRTKSINIEILSTTKSKRNLLIS